MCGGGGVAVVGAARGKVAEATRASHISGSSRWTR